MIEGLMIEVTSEELRQHLGDRADHHRRKTEFYAKQVTSLEEGGLDQDGSTADPVSNLARRGRLHREKASYFSFMAEHLIEGERYRLSQEDLSAIEIASRYYPGAF